MVEQYAPPSRMPADLEKKARDKGWPLADVDEMLQRFSPIQIQLAMERMSLDQARQIMSGETPDEETPLYIDEQEEYISNLRSGAFDLRWLTSSK